MSSRYSIMAICVRVCVWGGGGGGKQQEGRYLLAGQCMRRWADRLREGVSIDHKGGYLAQWVDSLVLLRQLHVHTQAYNKELPRRDAAYATPVHLLTAVFHQVYRIVLVVDPFQCQSCHQMHQAMKGASIPHIHH